MRGDQEDKPFKPTSYYDRFSPRDRHRYGVAIDFTLYDIATGKAIDMGTDFDTFTSVPTEELSEEIHLRRALLTAIMEKHHFETQTKNWWHFDYRDWFQYCIVAACQEVNAHHLSHNGLILAC